jgi:endonuclease/exonuclease/phosphatase family metal-dependent hydrolase
MKRNLFFKIPVCLLSLALLFAGYSPFFSLKEKGFASAYWLASKLTDPLCRAHQLYRETLLVDALYPAASSFERGLKKNLLFLDSAANLFFSLFTTFPGIELRFLALALQDHPFLYFKGDAEEKKWEGTTLSLLSWNLCCVSGGYSITDGGVLPWHFRFKQCAQAIREQNADILCLYEIFDIQTALGLYEALKKEYSHFYFNIGPHAIGLSSGLFIASKLPVEQAEFVPFPKAHFDGRAKHCKKGFFSFELLHGDMNFVRIYATHLQHSECPENPTEGELKAREQEMGLIVAHMKHYQDQTCLLTGDLNLEEKEMHAARWSQYFDHGSIEGCGCTWGGDAFCSMLLGKPVSPPLNLDHTLMTKRSKAILKTFYVDTGFEGDAFNASALSDHKGLLSIVSFSELAPLQGNEQEKSYRDEKVRP